MKEDGISIPSPHRSGSPTVLPCKKLLCALIIEKVFKCNQSGQRHCAVRRAIVSLHEPRARGHLSEKDVAGDNDPNDQRSSQQPLQEAAFRLR